MYTKGEWKVSKNDTNKPFKFRIETETSILAAVYNEANANLIASSPDMYEALKDLSEYIRYNMGNAAPIYEKAQKALSKAEGR
jgi:hypothetical protein